MSDVLKLLASSLGLGVVGLCILYAVRGAIATAVQQAGKLEIERLKGKLDEDLESKRQAFTQTLERERGEAAKALEQFKAELTLDAEVRREVAIRKVDGLLKIARISDTMIGRVYADSRDRDFSDNIAACDEYFLAVREMEALLEPRIAGALTSFGALLQNTMGRISDPGAQILEMCGTAEDARRQMLAVIRRELQLERDGT